MASSSTLSVQKLPAIKLRVEVQEIEHAVTLCLHVHGNQIVLVGWDTGVNSVTILAAPDDATREVRHHAHVRGRFWTQPKHINRLANRLTSGIRVADTPADNLQHRTLGIITPPRKGTRKAQENNSAGKEGELNTTSFSAHDYIAYPSLSGSTGLEPGECTSHDRYQGSHLWSWARRSANRQHPTWA